jgi:hypothetical protein
MNLLHPDRRLLESVDAMLWAAGGCRSGQSERMNIEKVRFRRGESAMDKEIDGLGSSQGLESETVKEPGVGASSPK